MWENHLIQKTNKKFPFQTIPKTVIKNEHFKQNGILLSKTDYLLNESF